MNVPTSQILFFYLQIIFKIIWSHLKMHTCRIAPASSWMSRTLHSFKNNVLISESAHTCHRLKCSSSFLFLSFFFSFPFSFSFWDRASYWTWSLKLHYLASERAGSACVCFRSPAIADVHSLAIFVWLLSIWAQVLRLTQHLSHFCSPGFLYSCFNNLL